MTIEWDDEQYLAKPPASRNGYFLFDDASGDKSNFILDTQFGEVDITASDRFSYFAIQVTPSTARLIADHLLKLADEADKWNEVNDID